MLKKLVKFLDDRYNNNIVYSKSVRIRKDLAALWLILIAVILTLFVGYIVIYSAGARWFMCILSVMFITLWSLSTLADI